MTEKTILIVEDEETNSLYLESLLAINKYKYLLATDGEKAIEIVNNNKIDLILMDIKLPRLNGLEATKIIKKKYPDMPIIAQTAYAMSGDKEKILAAGCDDYVSKPIDKDCLLKKIRDFIG